MHISTLDRSKAPKAGALKNISLPTYHTARLSNGIPVYMLPHGPVGVSHVQIVFLGLGTAHQSRTGLSGWTAAMLSEGTKNYDSLSLAQALDARGAWLGHEVGEEYISLSLSTLSKHMESSLPLLAEVAFAPVFPESEFESRKQRRFQKLQVSATRTSWQAGRYFKHLLYGAQHPYGGHMGKDELEALDLPMIRDYYRCFSSQNCFVLMTGNFDQDASLALLEKQFGSSSLPDTHAAPVREFGELAFAAGRQQYDHPGMQSSIRLGYPSISRKHPDYYDLTVVNTILGGYFGSRLMKNIREEKGYTYGIHAGMAVHQRGGHFVVQTDAGNEYVEPVISEVKKEMAILASTPVPAGELEQVKNYLLGQSINSRETPFQLADILRYSLVYDISFEEMDKRFDHIRDIDAETIMQLAQTHLRPDDMLEVVVGGGG